ncbi:MAG TPA: galactokinase [Bacteroidales bacterium]|nr:MAG: Galactokinase [Bacteroidetes bacterium ADurb.Bin217]HPM13593.1 galactokinase [Bacteroidales bacterium]
MTIEDLQSLFFGTYGASNEPLHIYFSPGRVNLIGEHTDYNGGFVLPCAISFGTYCCIRKTKSPSLYCTSAQITHKHNIPIYSIEKQSSYGWANYILGVYAQFVKFQLQAPHGYELLVWGNVPRGAGLSSSAALEMAVAYAINDIEQYGLSVPQLARMCQTAEHEYTGVHCGIMDQFASGMGKQDAAIYLNCTTLEYEHIPVILDDYTLIIGNTNSPHKLESSKYNERVYECKQAIQDIQSHMPIKQLADISFMEFTRIAEYIPELYRKRARHVVSEIYRTQQAVEALKQKDIHTFGLLMNQSHESLKTDYEVTGLHLDTLTFAAQNHSACIGSRMTGGGFGGSTVSLVRTSAIDSFIQSVGSEYVSRTGICAEFYPAHICNGSHKVL